MGIFDKRKPDANKISNEIFEEKEPAGENQEEAQQKGIVTIYACRRDGSDVREIAEGLFQDISGGEVRGDGRNFVITLQDGTAMEFHIMDDPKETAGQAAGMRNYFSRAPLEDQKLKEAILMQIGLFNCVVGVGFTITDERERSGGILQRLYRLADKMAGFLLYPNMSIFCPDGRLLLSIEGKTDMTEFRPVADARLLDRDTPESEADRARRERSVARCREKGIPVIEKLRVYVPEEECAIAPKDEVLRRAVCIFATGVCSEVFREGGPGDEKQYAQMMNTLEEKYGFRAQLSPKEREYLQNPRQHEKEHILYDWRYEDCAALLWALGLLEIGEPDHVCDVSALGELFWKQDFSSLSAAAKMRSKEEILDLQDLILRYDWACTEMRIKGGTVPGLDPMVVREWHYALNWLTGADGAEWDDVTPNT